jgi:CO dehydrogenase maturation factor
MRLALVGKGGSGKSVVAGTVARILARQGSSVLALDVDTLPGLAYSVGLGRIGDAGMPPDLAERQEGKGWVLREEVSAEALVDRYALDGPDGIRFLQLGKLPDHVRPGSVVAFRHVVESFRRPGWSIVGDLAAGTRQGFGGWAAFAELIAIVAEPTSSALLSARRLAALVHGVAGAKAGLIVNKSRGDGHVRARFAELGLPIWAEIPYDEEVAVAERRGAAPIDAAPGSAAVSAITRLTTELGVLLDKESAA